MQVEFESYDAVHEQESGNAHVGLLLVSFSVICVSLFFERRNVMWVACLCQSRASNALRITVSPSTPTATGPLVAIGQFVDASSRVTSSAIEFLSFVVSVSSLSVIMAHVFSAAPMGSIKVTIYVAVTLSIAVKSICSATRRK